MLLANAKADVQQLLDQTTITNTQFDDTNFLPDALNRARRAFAAILPESEIPKLIKIASLTIVAGVGTYPTDFLKKMKYPYVTIGLVGGTAYPAKRIAPEDNWRRTLLESSSLTLSDATSTKYYIEASNGILLFPATSTLCYYQYIMTPTDLGAVDNIELPLYVDDLVIWHVFEQCMSTQRGDQELAKYLLYKQKSNIAEVVK